jgi:hypothetical protein
MSELIATVLLGAAFGAAVVAIALASDDPATTPAPAPSVTVGGPR